MKLTSNPDSITRFAPSPTGLMHLGSARAAIMPFLFAKRNNGRFFLRIDNTDFVRSKKEFIEQIFTDLDWLEINYEYVLYQDQRTKIYDKYFEQLLKNGFIYACYDSEQQIDNIKDTKRQGKKAPIFSFEDRKLFNGQNAHWRFKLQDEEVKINDKIFGDLKFNKDWSDPVIKRSDGTYCYIFCSVIDDIDQTVSHIIRGSEHISNSVVQQQIGNAVLGEWKVNWIHFPILLDPIGKKLSKRNESLSLKSLKENSLESWTLFSFLTESNKKKVISCNMQDYIDTFYIENFSRVSKKFFERELWERNKWIFRNLSDDVVISKDVDLKAWHLLKDNCNKWSEFKNMYENLMIFKNSQKIPSGEKQFYREIFSTESGPPMSEVLKYLADL